MNAPIKLASVGLTNGYIEDRIIVRQIRSIAVELGLTIKSFSDDWVLQLSTGNHVRHVIGYRFDLNPSASALAAQDKVATYALLTAGQITAIPHKLLRLRMEDYPDMAGRDQMNEVFGQLDLNYPFVLKPLNGTGGRGVVLVRDQQELTRLLAGVTRNVAYAVSPYWELAEEYRVIMLDGEALLAYRKHVADPTSCGNESGLILFNLARGAYPVVIESHERQAELTGISRGALRALNLRLGAVDVAQAKDGRMAVVEVNDGIMMEYFSRVSPEHHEFARRTYRRLIEEMFRG